MAKGIAKNPEEKSKKISLSKVGKKRIDLTKRNFENNPMKNPIIKQKMIRTMKNNYKIGKMKPFIPKGSTREDVFGIERAKEIKDKIMMNHNHLVGENNPAKRQEVREKIRLSKLREKNPAWNNGSSFKVNYSENFGRAFKRGIRKRDNYICLKCKKHQEKENRSLAVHHINYNKELTIPENCCALCRKCHSEINFNRPHWIRFFQSLLAEKYNYQYSENQEIKLDLGNRE